MQKGKLKSPPSPFLPATFKTKIKDHSEFRDIYFADIALKISG